MEDITQQNNFVSSSQSDAIQNINGSKVFGIDPDVFKSNKDELQPEVERMSLPPIAAPIVARNIAISPEHAAAISPDAENLSIAEKVFGSIGTAIKKKFGPEQELNDLYGKKRTNNGQLNEDDDLRLRALQIDSQDNFGMKDYGLNGWENLPATIATGIVDMGALAVRNKETIAKIAGAETAIASGGGALVGSALGGVGAIPGAITGAGIGLRSGLAHGYLAAALIDGYNSSANSVYGTLDNAKNKDGTPLNIDEENKRYISNGVGAVAGTLGVGSQYLLFKNVPFLKTFLKDAPQLVLDPANAAMKEAIIGLGKAATTMGAAGTLSELATIIGEEVGHTSDQNSQLSFTNGLLNALKKIKSNEEEAASRLALAGTAGALTGVAIHGIGLGANKLFGKNIPRSMPGDNAKDVTPSSPLSLPPGPSSPSDIMSVKGTPHEQAIQVLQFQDAVDGAQKAIQETNLHKIAPHQASEIRGQMNSDGADSVHFSKEGIDEFVGGDAKKAEKVRNLIDPSGVLNLQNNATVKVPMTKFLDLHDEYPTISEYAKLHPEGPSPSEARKYADQLEAADLKRQELRTKLGIGEKSLEEQAQAVKINPGVDDNKIIESIGSKEVADAYLARLDRNEIAFKDDPQQMQDIAIMRERVSAIKDQLPDSKSYKATLEQALNTKEPNNDVFGESDYLNQPTFTKAIEGVLSEHEVKSYNEAQLNAKKQIVDHINETAQYEMNNVIDVVEQHALEVERELQEQRLLNHPGLAIVDKFYNPETPFRPTVRYDEAGKLIAPHHKEGFSPFAIDPRQLTPEQKAAYLKDPQLKKHKLFVKGGISPDESAYLVGVNGGDNLLKLLSETPSREDVIAGRVAQREADIKNQAIDSVDLNKIGLTNAYRANTANHIEEMKILLRDDWSAAKKGIKRIALPLPRIEELTNKARNVILQTKVGNLNPTQFKVGERKSQRIALNAILKNEVEKAFINKESAALNSELTIATHIGIAEVNRVEKFVKYVNKPENRQVLKDAGPIYEKAMDEIQDLHNFNPSKKNQAEIGAFKKFVKDQIKAGNGNFEVPERLSDVRESIKDMTVEEVKVYGDRMKSIFHQAKLKNRLYEKFGKEAQETQALDELAAQLHEVSINHVDYDEKRAVVKQGKLGKIEAVVKAIGDSSSMLRNMEHILLNADFNKVGGLYNESILGPLKGVGKYEGQGEAGKGKDLIELSDHFEKIIEKFGKDEWSKMQVTSVSVPEFKDNPKLNYGKLSKANLFVMLLNNGNEGNVQRMSENFDTDIETIRKILDRELDHNHAVAAQQIIDSYSAYFPRVVKLHEEMTGVTPELVQAVPFTFKDKVYPGGYYPLQYASEMSLDKIRKRSDQIVDTLTGEKKFDLSDKFYTDDMTRHGHTERRTGNDRPINISINSIGMGFETIIHDLNFRKPIADTLKIVTHPSVAKDLASTVGLSDYNVVVNTIVDAASSKQMENNALFDSSKVFDRVQANIRSGLSVGYLVGNLNSILIQPTSMIQTVGLMGPSGAKHWINTTRAMLSNPLHIGQFYELAGEIHPAIHDYLQGLDENSRDAITKKLPKNSNNVLSKMQDKVNDVGFETLGQVDQLQKVITVMTAYSQYMAGDAEGHSYDKIMKMTPEERDHQAKVYASSIARLTLTSGSQIDRAPIQKKYPLLTMFYNDARNSVNNTFRQSRRVRQEAKQGNYYGASVAAISALMTLAAIRGYQDPIRGYTGKTPFQQGEGIHDKEFAVNMLKYLATSPTDVIAGDLPLLRDINFAYQSETYKPKDVTSIQTTALTHIKDTFEVGMNFMDYVNHNKTLHRKDLKSVAFTASYLTGGIPVNALFKLYDAYEKVNPNAIFTPSLAEDYNKKLEEFKKEHSSDVSEEEMKALDDIRVQVTPNDKTSASLDKKDSKVKD